MSDFVQAAKVSDIADPGKLMLEVDDRLVVLLHIDGQFFCMDDV